MKGFNKIICSMIITAILASVAALSAGALTTYVKGDADGDGEITISDVTKIQKVIAKLDDDPKGDIERRGNVTGETFDIIDATAIQRHLAGYETPYKIGTTVRYDEYELPIIFN